MTSTDGDLPEISSVDFPPAAWLGYGLNLIEACPTDIDSVRVSIISSLIYRLMKFMQITTNIKTVHRVLGVAKQGTDRSIQG